MYIYMLWTCVFYEFQPARHLRAIANPRFEVLATELNMREITRTRAMASELGMNHGWPMNWPSIFGGIPRQGFLEPNPIRKHGGCGWTLWGPCSTWFCLTSHWRSFRNHQAMDKLESTQKVQLFPQFLGLKSHYIPFPSHYYPLFSTPEAPFCCIFAGELRVFWWNQDIRNKLYSWSGFPISVDSPIQEHEKKHGKTNVKIPLAWQTSIDIPSKIYLKIPYTSIKHGSGRLVEEEIYKGHHGLSLEVWVFWRIFL